ncbi:AsmA family protein [Bosea vaviloviae]|uniref:AsmA domain-containing protein n=1 Tax=Bosea vaviloviae TaxID=1526658 RepID=A0A1D7U5Y4_9HYPH|nr:AsmA family protein [Bosea vaviloviae]AOO82742.1 hypothetical protein BHK69_21935 [Bosea vaviloviae]
MTRRASILAYGLVIAVVLLGLQSWSIAVGRVEQRVIAAIELRTGLEVTGLERAEIALLPLPRISLSKVTFRQRDDLLTGSALRIKARARILPLLIGQFRFDRIELVVPQIDVAVAGTDDGLGDWLTPPLAYLEKLKVQSRIIITAGSVFMRAQGAIRTILRDVNLVLQDRDAGEPLSLSGSLTWRGVPTQVSLLWPMAGANARLALTAASPVMNLQFEGIRSGLNDPVVNGRLSLATKALPELLGWFGETPRLASAIGPLHLTADAQIKPHEASLSNAVVSLEGERLEGAIKLGDVGGRLALSGTLAGATLDLGRLYGRLGVLPATAPENESAPLDFDAWTAHDIDLRISVDAARVNGARLDDVATYLLVKKGRFEAGLLRAGAYGGSVKGRLLALAAPGGVDVKLQGGFDKVNLGKAAGDVPDLAKLSGTGTLQIALDGLGATVEEVVASLGGKAGLSLRQGELGGIAFGELLRRMERNPSLVLRDWRQGKTPFETAAVNLSIANGVAMVTDAQMIGPGYQLTLAGQVSLPGRAYEMGLLLAPSNGPLRLPFTFKGPLENPTLELDTEALSRGATAFPTQLLR